MNNSNNNETFDRRFIKYLWWFIAAIFAIFVIYLVLFNFCNGWIFDLKETGQIGDTLGGIMGPFVGILGAGLSFLAFWIQYKANEEQKKALAEQQKALEKQEEQIEKQTRDLKVERFESKFYEMLKLHRANVEEMNIGNKIIGRKIFSYMIKELSFYYNIIECFYKEGYKGDKPDIDYADVRLTQLVYSLFFYGIVSDAKKQLEYDFNKSEWDLLLKSKGCIENIIASYLAHADDNSMYEYFLAANLAKHYEDKAIEGTKTENASIKLFYTPFNGHINRLSHYYRHLYYTARFVTQQDFLSEEEKEDYIRILRAQLSNYEQLLLYYNAIAFFPDDWEDLFIKYRLIKNLPIPLADFGENPKDKYAAQIAAEKAKGKIVFEQLRQSIASSTPTP